MAHFGARPFARQAADRFVRDFGIALSLFFTDPDGLYGEACLHNPKATVVGLKPRGAPVAGYKPVSQAPKFQA